MGASAGTPIVTAERATVYQESLPRQFAPKIAPSSGLLVKAAGLRKSFPPTAWASRNGAFWYVPQLWRSLPLNARLEPPRKGVRHDVRNAWYMSEA